MKKALTALWFICTVALGFALGSGFAIWRFNDVSRARYAGIAAQECAQCAQAELLCRKAATP